MHTSGDKARTVTDQGTKRQKTIDRCVTQDSIQYKRNLSMAWIDYGKAFDTISHEVLIDLLERLFVHPIIMRCMKLLFPVWETHFTITSDGHSTSTGMVTYRRGLFQGDSLSPLVFCISLLPLYVTLREPVDTSADRLATESIL